MMRTSNSGAGECATIYLLDGDAAVRDSLSSLLKTLDVNVETFVNAGTFLAADLSDGPSCLVAEAHLPDMDGVELLEQLRRCGRSIPTILIASDSDLPLAVRALRSGAIDFIEKPLIAGTVLSRVKQALAR